MTKLFLTGYEGEKLSDFLSKLKKAKVTAVIDVREIPLSRKNGFSGDALKKELSKIKIKYYHFSELGSSKEMRENLYSTGDYLSFFKKYRNYVRKKESSIKELNRVVTKEKKATLMCFEKNNDLCHRSIITSEIIKINPQLMVIPI